MTDEPHAAADDARLDEARWAFAEAQRTWEAAREHLLRTHIETARLWGGAS